MHTNINIILHHYNDTVCKKKKKTIKTRGMMKERCTYDDEWIDTKEMTHAMQNITLH